MKRLTVVTIALAMLMLGAMQFNAVAQGKSSGDVKDAILKLEDTWLSAEKDNKPEDAALLFADDAVFTDADGLVRGKADQLNNMHQVKWETAENSGIKVIPHGKTIIVTGRFDGKGKDSAGKKVNVSEQWTDVWMKTQHMGWQVVASQSSPVNK